MKIVSTKHRQKSEGGLEMKKARFTTIVLICLVLMFVFSGCSQTSAPAATSAAPATSATTVAPTASPAPPTTPPIVELTELCWDRGNIKADYGTVTDNWLTKYCNEKLAGLGIKIKFVPVPNADRENQLSTLMAAGNAPDLCYSYNGTLISTYNSNNALVDFGPLFDQYGANIKAAYTQQDIDRGKFNGKQVAFECKYWSWANTTWFRKDWLDKLGLPIPTNLTEMYNTLKAIKDNDPGKVGDKLIPLALQGNFQFWANDILPAFVSTPPMGEKLVTPTALWPETKDCLQFLNKLYNEGLLKGFPLDKDGSQFKQAVVNVQIGSFVAFGHWPYHSAYGDVYKTLQANNPAAVLKQSYPWKADNGTDNFYEFNNNSPYYYYMFSPISTKHPDLCMQYWNWLADKDVNMVLNCGIAGTDYNIVDGVPQPVDSATYGDKVTAVVSNYCQFCDPFMTDPKTSLKTQAGTTNQTYINDFLSGSITDIKYPPVNLSLPRPLNDKNGAALDAEWGADVAKIIMASEADFENLFNTSVETWKKDGGTDVANEAIASYHQQYGN